MVNPHEVITQDHRINQFNISHSVCSFGLHISDKATELEKAEKKGEKRQFMTD